MSLNNWFCPLEEFPQITGCQEHGQGNGNYTGGCCWRARLSVFSGRGRNEHVCMSVCHSYHLVHFKSDVCIAFTLHKHTHCTNVCSFTLHKRDLLVFLCRKACKLESYVLPLTFACWGRNSFLRSESGKSVAFCECLQGHLELELAFPPGLREW